jgi:hypothetical protein
VRLSNEPVAWSVAIFKPKDLEVVVAAAAVPAVVPIAMQVVVPPMTMVEQVPLLAVVVVVAIASEIPS